MPRIDPLPLAQWGDDERRRVKPYEVKGRAANVFTTLLRHPKLCDAWLAFGGYTFNGSTLSARDREILVLRTALAAGCEYEWRQHVRIGRRIGLVEQDFHDIRQGSAAPGLSDYDAALLDAADELAAQKAISAPTWSTLATKLDERQLMDLVFTVGSYMTLAMALKSFEVELDADLEGIS